MVFRVAVLRRFPGPWQKTLTDAGAEVAAPSGEFANREEALAMVRGADGIASSVLDRVDAELMEAAGTRLRIVANFGVGFNNIDVAEATRRGVAVSNTPDVLTEATADVAWGLLMAAARRFGEGERDVRAGRWAGWAPKDYIALDLAGKTLGIVGAGRIGAATARRSMGWRMRVLYASPRANGEMERELGARRVALGELLEQSDFVSIHCPLTPETRHLIGAAELARMKPTAVLVNTARGPVVDEKALVEALKGRRIFAAGLDVFEEEPKLAPGLAELENAVLLPHIGSATQSTREAMARIVCENLIDALEGREPRTRVNRAG